MLVEPDPDLRTLILSGMIQAAADDDNASDEFSKALAVVSREFQQGAYDRIVVKLAAAGRAKVTVVPSEPIRGRVGGQTVKIPPNEVRTFSRATFVVKAYLWPHERDPAFLAWIVGQSHEVAGCARLPPAPAIGPFPAEPLARLFGLAVLVLACDVASEINSGKLARELAK